jgi:hypothetical protein
VGCLGLWFRIAEGEASVVKALEKQDDIRKSVVDGKDDLMDVSRSLWSMNQKYLPW